MIYQVRANIFFDEVDEARDFYHDCEVALHKGITVNPDAVNAQKSIAELLLCGHDTDPAEPCDIVTAIESD